VYSIAEKTILVCCKKPGYYSLAYPSSLALFSRLAVSPCKKVDHILVQDNYILEFEYQGCFGGGKETLEIKDKKVAMHTFPVFGEADDIKEKIDTLAWTREKEMTLREVFNIGVQITGPETCTTTTKYVLKGGAQSVAFKDGNCRVSDIVGHLLKSEM
jgi:hypothetical protein